MSTRTLASLAIGQGLAATAAAQPTPNPPAPPWATAAPPATLPVGLPAALPAVPAVSPALDPAQCPPDLGPCDWLCGPPGRAWVSGEWLYWVASGQSLPPLVTASPPGTPRNLAGVLGGPGTATLFGGRRANNDWRSGFRLTAGTWLDDAQTLGVAADFFFLGSSRDRFAAASDGSAILARPFVNALTGGPDAQLVSFPGVVAGAITADAKSDFIGAGAFLTGNLCCGPCGRADLLLGYRFLNLRDQLTVGENLTALPGDVLPAGTQFLITDRFRTDNDFHGVPIGISAEQRFGSFFAAVRSSVALGVSHQTTTIDGSTAIALPGGPPVAFPGGVLTQATNIGRYTHDAFAVVPEVGVRAGAQVTSGLRVFVGYNFLYWSSVARAGDQIDLRVNPNHIPPAGPLGGPALPAFVPVRTGFWMQGISVGAEWRF